MSILARGIVLAGKFRAERNEAEYQNEGEKSNREERGGVMILTVSRRWLSMYGHESLSMMCMTVVKD